MTDEILLAESKSLNYKNRIVQLVQKLNYHNNTFARIPLTNLNDVAKTAVLIISSILGYKTTAVYFKNRDAKLQLMAIKGMGASEDVPSNSESRFVEMIWRELHGPANIDIGKLSPDMIEDASLLGMKNILLAVPIIGVYEPGEKQVGMILVSGPPQDFESSADIMILEIINGLVSGAMANCLSLQYVKRKNLEVKGQRENLQKSLDNLESAHNRMLTIIESIGAVVYIIDVTTYKIIYINKLGMEIYGEVVGSLCWQTLHQGMEGPCDFCPNNKLIYDDSLAGKTYAWEHFNPSIQRWFSMHDRLLRWIDGSLVKIQISVDITERKQQEMELKELRDYLTNIIDSMPSILIGVDNNCVVTQWNKRAEVVTGVSADDAQGKPLASVFPFMESKMTEITQSIRDRKIKQDRKVPFIMNNQNCYEDITIYPLASRYGEGAVIRLDDVTEKVRLEKSMLQSEKMLSVGGLAAGMAHEINNPLAGMIQNAAVLSNRLGIGTEIPANLKAAQEAGTTIEAIKTFMMLRDIPRFINSITESGQRAVEIVNNMLSFSRKDDASRSSHLLSDLMDKTLKLAEIDYNLKKRYDFRKIEIRKQYAEKLPFVLCHSATIQQVFLNILQNGAQAMQDAMTVNPMFLIRIQSETDSGMVLIEIEDNGPGMNEDTCKRVFEPFFTTKPVGVGTGLGLSVSYFIITDHHNGEISVISKPGEGTKFIIRLPVEGNLYSGRSW